MEEVDRTFGTRKVRNCPVGATKRESKADSMKCQLLRLETELHRLLV